ncbi:MAG: PilZ domain-containing protein, partial [Polyangiaceae bacterium]
MDERDRKDRRHVVALPVTIISRNVDIVAVTEDVSLRGFFLRMNNPPKMLQLLRMKMKLEPTGTEITVLGVGRHVV